ncbi:GH92 family glycosyl hydrolase [Ancrocorticia populi]|uniref:GH92 family glycosyl hydrolase n=3 Tax=Ancrocorticia populi TaxID=2175228 RepID=UPI002355FF2C|nr:GH92 family glycosyl hydrolase [Ancrocorticia populi]
MYHQWISRRPSAGLMAAAVVCAGLVVPISPATAAQVDALDAVDPFIGTEETVSINEGNARGNAAYGNTMPGATVPFGMIQFSPKTYATEQVNSDIKHTRGGYEYNADTITGFGLTRLSGTGCSGRFGGNDFPLTPYTGALEDGSLPVSPREEIESFYLPFEHANEDAEPGYYTVTTDDGVQSELTSTTRTAVGRFTFPEGDDGSNTLILDAGGSNNDLSGSEIAIDPDTQTVTGSVTAKIVCASGPSYTAHMTATFDQPFDAYGTWDGNGLDPEGTSASATTTKHGSGAWLAFSGDGPVTARIGLSYVSVDGAAGNLAAESSDLSFDQVREQASGAWGEALGTVDARGASAEQNTKFYTALYHAFGHPNVFEDADGRYMGYDDQIHSVESGRHFYVNFSGWDTYRSQAQLVALTHPDVASDINQSIIDMVDQSGAWSSWPSYNRIQTKMSGDSLQVIVAQTDAMGATNYDRHHALESMVESQSVPNAATQSNRSDAFLYTTLGWVDGDKKGAATSRTLEYVTDDFAIAQLAERLGDTESYELYSQRSQNWKSIFNFQNGHVDARNRNGFMDTALNTQGDQFEQSTGKQYSFNVPFNMEGLIEARGGVDEATADLDKMLEQLDAGAFSEYTYMTNQPSFGLPWVYNWLQDPTKATDTLDRVVDELYGTGPDGLLGNDDLGSLSAWYVWASLGLYPGIYGTGEFLVSSPMFEDVTISAIGSDRVISISAPGATSGARYISELSVDGDASTSSWLEESFARNGGSLAFTMTADASATTWGTAREDAPPSYTQGVDDLNGRGITHDGAKNAGTLDVNGATLSYEKLEEQGVVPGGEVPFEDGGVTFSWPKSADGGHPDHYIPHGQYVKAEEGLSSTGISFLGLATNGPSSGTATVVYTDGTEQDVPVSFSDWTTDSPTQGDTALLTLNGRNTKDGGSDTAKPNLYATEVVGLDESKTVEGVILPTDVDKGIMHLFSVGFQDPAAGAAIATNTSLSLGSSTIDEGATVTADVTVRPADAQGTVTVLDGSSAELAEAELGSDGTAQIELPNSLEPGKHTLTATFAPEDETAFRSSISSAVTLTVLPSDTPREGTALWTRSYEQGTPAPAGFPQSGEATGIRGESAVQPNDVAQVVSNGPNLGNIKEYVSRLADGNPSTKWYAAGSGAPTEAEPLSAVYELTEPRTVTGYSLTAAGDSAKFPNRDPKSWQILGSNAEDPDLSGGSWEVISTETNQTFASDGLTRFYQIEDPGKYSHYQLRITGNAGGEAKNENTQLADWTLSSDAGSKTKSLGISVHQNGTAPDGDGSQALRYSGRVLDDGPASSTTVIQMDMDVPISDGTSLSYLVWPDTDAAAVAVDVVYSGSEKASEASVLEGDPSSAVAGAWTPVTVDLSSLAGATVKELRLRYEDPAAKAGQISGWVDSLTIGTPVIDSDNAWTYLEEPDVDPAQGHDDRTVWTTTDFELSDQWDRAFGPFGAKGTGTDLGSDFPVSTQLGLYKDGKSAPVTEAYFFRSSFSLSEEVLSTGAPLTGTVVFDDTATVYVNGQRVAGWNDKDINENIQYQTPSGTSGIVDPQQRTFTVPADALVAGVNTIAVEIHQCNSTSSDVYFAMPDLHVDASGTPIPFRDGQLNATYDSDEVEAPDGSDYYTWLLTPFNDAQTEADIMGPNEVYPSGTSLEDLIGINDLTVVNTNNGPERFTDRFDPAVEEALTDGAGKPYVTMSDGLGDTIGPLYTQALANNELPKTEALLKYRIEKPTESSRDAHQNAKDAYQYKRPFVRMGFTEDDGLIQKWDTDGGYNGLAGDGSFPSGHTTHSYAQGITMATLLPELSPQILARTSEYGNNRIILSFHYPTDIMGGRIVGEDMTARRWADPEYQELLFEAQDELTAVLAQKCRETKSGDTFQECVVNQEEGLSDDEALEIYHDRLTYGFLQVTDTELAPSVPEDAGNLLLTTFPDLTDTQRTTVLAATSLPSGYVLDQPGDFGSYQRLDLAAAMAATVEVGPDGELIVNGVPVGEDGLPIDDGEGPTDPTDPDDPVTVTPDAVTFDDRAGTNEDTFTIPSAKGVDYLVGSNVLPTGTYPGSGTVTVTAEAQEGYILDTDAASEWTHTFSTDGDSIPAPETPSESASPGNPSESPQDGNLPVTGAQVAGIAALALLLLAGGTALVIRRRRGSADVDGSEG